MKLKDYLKEEICHHEKRICKNCGNIMTCRCKTEKKEIYVDKCINCEDSDF